MTRDTLMLVDDTLHNFFCEAGEYVFNIHLLEKTMTPGYTSLDQMTQGWQGWPLLQKHCKIEELSPGAPSRRLPWTAGLSSRACP